MEAWRAELYHHGILGMKWGTRKGPPYPLDAEDHTAAEKKAGWRKSLNGGSGEESKLKKRLTKGDTAGSIKPKKPDSTVKKVFSERQKQLERDYQKKGMSSQEARVTAEKRARVEKIIAGAAALTVVAAAAYVAHDKYTKEYVGKVLKAGTEFHTIAGNEQKDMGKVFYAAYKWPDKVIYKGLYGNDIASKSVTKSAFDVVTKATKDMRIPARREAAKVFSELYKSDTDFRNAAKSMAAMQAGNFMATDMQRTVGKIATGTMTDRQILNQGYGSFNIGLAYHTPEIEAAKKKFYDRLKELGYNAILDLNDSKYSGFKSDAPVIVFDTENIVKTSVKKLTDSQLQLNNVGQDLIRNGVTYATEIGLTVAGGLAYTKSIERTNKAVVANSRTNKKTNRVKGATK